MIIGNHSKDRHPGYDTSQYENPVQKMLGCGKESAGYSEHRCVYCGGDIRRIGFSCKSGFCLSCAKKYVDDFVGQVSQVLHGGMNYRHIVLTIPKHVQRQLHLPTDDNYTYPFLTTIIRPPRVLNLRMGATQVAPL